MNSGLSGAFKLFFRKFERIFAAPISMRVRKIKQKLNPQGIASRVAADIGRSVKNIGEKPASIKEYYLIGDHYVAKKAVYAFMIVLILLAVLFIKFAYPWLISSFFTKDMWISSSFASGYFGKVRL